VNQFSAKVGKKTQPKAWSGMVAVDWKSLATQPEVATLDLSRPEGDQQLEPQNALRKIFEKAE